jgi:phage shock protein PspC (stress-responsive transcriptional regulator)
VRRLYRDPANRIVAGVAAGIAEHLLLPILAVRIGFVVLLAANGLGALLYVVFWAVLPAAPAAGGLARRRTGVAQVMGLLALGAGVIVLQVQVNGLGIGSTLVALIALVALGAGIIWHQGDPLRRRRAGEVASEVASGVPVAQAMRRASESEGEGTSRWFLLRLIGGAALVVIGIIGILAFLTEIGGGRGLGNTLTGLIFALLAVGDWCWRWRPAVPGLRPVAEGEWPASASRSGRRSPPWCTTRCCTPWL